MHFIFFNYFLFLLRAGIIARRVVLGVYILYVYTEEERNALGFFRTCLYMEDPSLNPGVNIII